jgi:hypothetical protein
VGSLTSTLKFYKPAATEFIDPDVQLNRNWNLADPATRRLLEYEYTNLQTPPTDGILPGSKFYKPYSNSIVYWDGAVFPQGDNNAFVSSWVRAGSFLQPGMEEHPDYPIAYRIIKNPSTAITEVEWSGALWNDGNTMTLNGNVTNVLALPLNTVPAVSKYFTIWGGNTTANYCIGRMGFFTGSNDLQYKRYGQDPPFGDECRLELTGISYSLEVTG